MPGKAEPKPTIFTARNIGFGVAYFILFGLTVADLGMVSHILNTVGNPESRYPSGEFKHALGLILFATIYTLLHLLGTLHLNLLLIALLHLVGVVFYWTSAGIIFRVTPYEVYTTNKTGPYPAVWQQQPWIGWAHLIVGIQGVSWAAGAVDLVIFFGILADMCSFSIKRHQMFDRLPKREAIKDEKSPA